MKHSFLQQAGLRLLFCAALILSFFGGSTSVQSVSETLVIAIDEDPGGQDPANIFSWLVTSQVYDTLTTFPSGSNTPQPGLAASWSVSADGLTWTFNLHPGVTFHDGQALNGAAVVFNFMRWWDPTNPYRVGDYEYFASLFGVKDAAGSLLAGVSSTGEHQVVFQLTRQENMFPTYLGIPAFAIASPAAIQAGTLDQHPVGTGPYKFVEWVPGDHTLLTANPSYWRTAPYMAGLMFKVITEPTDRYNAVQANTAHVAYYMPAYDYYKALQDMNVSVMTGYGLNTGYLGFNRGKSPLGNDKVRQAIAHAINKAKLLNDYYEPVDLVAGQFLPPDTLGYVEGMADYEYDPTKAKALLAEAGYPNGFSIKLTYRDVIRIYLRQPAPVAWAIQQDLAAVGINVTVEAMESSAFLDQVYAGEAELFLIGWGADYPHPASFFSIFCDNGLFQAYGPIDPALCATVNAARLTTDPAQQETLYKNASQAVRDTLPLVPLAHGRNISIARSEVAGLLPSVYAEDFETVFLTNGVNQPVTPNSPATLQTDGYEAPTTTVSVPAGAVSQPVTLAYSLTESAPPPPPDQAALGTPFALTAYQNAAPLEQVTFAQPVAVAVDYLTYGGFRFDRASLELYINLPPAPGMRAQETGWVKAASTCPNQPPSQLDPQTHSFTAYTCQTGQFALFGEQYSQLIFIPAVRR